MTFRLSFLLVVVLASSWPADLAGRTPQDIGAVATESHTVSVAISPTGSFTIANSSGDVSIVGGGDAVAVVAVKRARGSSDADARRRLASISVEVTSLKGNVAVRTSIADDGDTSGAVDFTITVPSSVRVTARTFLGDLRITNVNGAVDASTVSGHLIVSALSTLRSASTVSGNVEIRDSLGDNISVVAMNGTVVVSRLTASSLDLNVGNGLVSCTDVSASRAYVRTDSGDINYSGPLSRGGLYQVQSRAGSVTFTPLGPTGFSLDASSFRGETRSEFPFGPDSMTTNRRGLNQAIRGAVGDAGASVTLRSLTGGVALRRP